MDNTTESSRSRSRSRGREPMMSTGRGGAGNIRTASASRNRAEDAVPFAERGRTVAPPLPTNPTGLVHAGRGGAGNIRSPSRDPARDAQEDAYEAQLVRERRRQEAGMTHSSGRGGFGNMSRSRSRSAQRGRDGGESVVSGEFRATGRGGWGNMHPVSDEDAKLRQLDEEDDRVRYEYENRHRGTDEYVSTGKGGAGNMHHFQRSSATVDSQETAHEAAKVHQQTHGRTTGRGGAGNWVAEEETNGRGRASEPAKGPIETVKELFRGVSRSRSRESSTRA